MNQKDYISQEQWNSWLNEYVTTCSATPARVNAFVEILIRKEGLTKLRKTVWQQWQQIIAANLANISNASTFNEVYEKVEQKKIKGVGASAMIETARQIADRYDIPLDDSCWPIIRQLPIVKKIGIPTRDIKEFFGKLSPQFLNLTNRQKLGFIFKYQNQINKMIRQGCLNSNIKQNRR